MDPLTLRIVAPRPKKKSKRVYKVKGKQVIVNPTLQAMEQASNVPFSTLLFVYDS